MVLDTKKQTRITSSNCLLQTTGGEMTKEPRILIKYLCMCDEKKIVVGGYGQTKIKLFFLFQSLHNVQRKKIMIFL